jgi:hypothetical protein
VKPIVDANGVVALPEGDIILTTGPLIGLGDHAVYSTLPERFAKLGYKVYLDQDNSARNQETLDLFWGFGLNPHIEWTSDKKPNAGYVRQGLFYEIANRYPIGAIEAMERAHGLPPPYSIAPRIYYKPKPANIDVSKAVICDFSAVSSQLSWQRVAEELRVMRGRFRNAEMIQVLFKDGIATQNVQMTGQSVRVNSIYEYLDLIASARAWVGSEAGGQSLAAAVRGEHDVYDLDARPEVVSLILPKTFNSRGYTYRGVDYRVATEGGFGSDYWFPHELQTHVYELRCAMDLAKMRALLDSPAPFIANYETYRGIGDARNVPWTGKEPGLRAKDTFVDGCDHDSAHVDVAAEEWR